jgi:hypothetical protein
LVRRLYGVPGSGVLEITAPNWGNLAAGIESILRQSAKPNVYNLTFWMLVAGLLLFRRAGLSTPWLLLPGLVVWQLLGLLGAYAGSRNEIRWWIGTSLDRILSQVAPLALLASALVAAAWLAAREKRRPAASKAESPPLTRRRSYRNLKSPRR